jgi:hypothetical protein
MNRIVKSVSFSKDDEFEMRLLAYVGDKGFSKKIKRLLQRDMEGGASSVTSSPSPKEITVDHAYVSSVI